MQYYITTILMLTFSLSAFAVSQANLDRVTQELKIARKNIKSRVRNRKTRKPPKGSYYKNIKRASTNPNKNREYKKGYTNTRFGIVDGYNMCQTDVKSSLYSGVTCEMSKYAEKQIGLQNERGRHVVLAPRFGWKRNFYGAKQYCRQLKGSFPFYEVSGTGAAYVPVWAEGIINNTLYGITSERAELKFLARYCEPGSITIDNNIRQRHYEIR